VARTKYATSIIAGAEDAERGIAARDRLIVGANQAIDEAEAAAGTQNPLRDFEPLADLGRAEKVERQAKVTRAPGSFPCVLRKVSSSESPIALSASALIRPPCAKPRLLQWAWRIRSASRIAPFSAFE
jgi:hypothetical protein